MIKVENITKKYSNFDGSEEGVSNVSFSVSKGEVVAILGPSGAGKSTLLKILAGLKNTDEGSFNFESGANIGYVSQEYTLWPHLNILENLTLAPSLKDEKNHKSIIEEANNLLTRFGLGDYKDSYPHSLSGGQKQRVALIRSLMMKPQILLLDEITSSIDPELTKSVFELIRTLANDGYTMLVVTHDISFAKSIADRILFLKKGRVVADKDTKTFFSDQNDEEIQSFISGFNNK